MTQKDKKSRLDPHSAWPESVSQSSCAPDTHGEGLRHMPLYSFLVFVYFAWTTNLRLANPRAWQSQGRPVGQIRMLVILVVVRELRDVKVCIYKYLGVDLMVHALGLSSPLQNPVCYCWSECLISEDFGGWIFSGAPEKKE